MEILTYTFRTNPFLPALRGRLGEVFVFGKMREDLERFRAKIGSRGPRLVLGLAQSWDENSYVESRALNRFHKTKFVEKDRPGEFELFLPDGLDGRFRVNARGSDSFCNWAMYQISSLLDRKRMETKHAFFHCHLSDLPLIERALAGIDL